MRDEDAFWLVWNPAGNSPTMRHNSQESADREAERLARMHDGHRFYVLKATRCYERNYVTRTDLRDALDDHPF